MSTAKKLLSAGAPVGLAQAINGTVQTLTLAGSASTDAAKITGEIVLISAGTGGAILPASDAGDTFLIKNESGNTATLYPPSGATINTTTSLSVPTAKSVQVFFSSNTKCHTNPTVPT